MRSFEVAHSNGKAPKAYVGLFGDNSVAVLDTSSNHVLKTIPIPAGPHGLVMTPDGKRVYASSDGDSSVSVIDTSTDEVIASINVGSTPHGLAITPDGSRVLVAGYGTNKVEAIDTRTNTIVWKTTVAQPHNLGITPDGRTAYAASQREGHLGLVIIDVASGTQRGSIPLNHVPRALTVSPDGEEVYFTQADVDAVLVLDRATNAMSRVSPSAPRPTIPFSRRMARWEWSLLSGRANWTCSIR